MSSTQRRPRVGRPQRRGSGSHIRTHHGFAELSSGVERLAHRGTQLRAICAPWRILEQWAPRRFDRCDTVLAIRVDRYPCSYYGRRPAATRRLVPGGRGWPGRPVLYMCPRPWGFDRRRPDLSPVAGGSALRLDVDSVDGQVGMASVQGPIRRRGEAALQRGNKRGPSAWEGRTTSDAPFDPYIS